MAACDCTEPISCQTCEDSGYADVRVGEDTLAMVACPDCDGNPPAFLPGVDDVLDGTREGWSR